MTDEEHINGDWRHVDDSGVCDYEDGYRDGMAESEQAWMERLDGLADALAEAVHGGRDSESIIDLVMEVVCEAAKRGC